MSSLHQLPQQTAGGAHPHPAHSVCDHLLIDGQDYYICQCGAIWEVFLMERRNGTSFYAPDWCPIEEMQTRHAADRSAQAEREVAELLAVGRDQLRMKAAVMPVLERAHR